MAIKATDRVKIEAYGEDLSGTFTSINAALEELVTGVAAANYEGGNAVQFKQGCVDSCITFAEQVRDAMNRMSLDVEAQTSFIAQNLGGAPVAVATPTGEVNRPNISTDESIELADSDALTSMMTLVESQMTAIRTAFDENLDSFVNLGNTDGWVGQEYDDLLVQIQSATEQVGTEISQSETNINTTIQNQLDALGL